MIKKANRDILRAARVKNTATVVGVSQRQVNRVLDGSQENETVVSVFMELQERENLLIEEVKKLVPFN